MTKKEITREIIQDLLQEAIYKAFAYKQTERQRAQANALYYAAATIIKEHNQTCKRDRDVIVLQNELFLARDNITDFCTRCKFNNPVRGFSLLEIADKLESYFDSLPNQ